FAGVKLAAAPSRVKVVPSGRLIVQRKLRGSAAPAGSVAAALRTTALPTVPPAGTVNVVIVGSTFLTNRSNEVAVVRPELAVAVMVAVIGPAGPSGGVYDQLQVPSAFLVTVPSEVPTVTVSRPSASSKVPVLLAGEPSITPTLDSLRVIVGGVIGGVLASST